MSAPLDVSWITSPIDEEAYEFYATMALGLATTHGPHEMDDAREIFTAEIHNCYDADEDGDFDGYYAAALEILRKVWNEEHHADIAA